MATGIVSIASDRLGMPLIARLLLAANALAYGVLWALYLARAFRHPRAVARDLSSHARGPGYFTLIAGTCVLGMQLVIVLPMPALAAALWLLGVLLYLVLIYTVFLCLIVRAEKPSLAQGLGGGWLVAVVATQAVSILGGHVSPSFPGAAHEILFATLCLWLAGGMLYVWIMGLVFYRYLFLPMQPADMGAAYWIDTGAMAISTLAGVTLIGNAAADPLLARLRPFVEGLTLLFWATATWWIS
jgi:tellurite resistance protein TehA-like permease